MSKHINWDKVKRKVEEIKSQEQNRGYKKVETKPRIQENSDEEITKPLKPVFPKQSKQPAKKVEDTKVESKEAPASDLTCIICGEPSNGKHFCIKCYKEFANKVLYIQVKKCKEFTKLDTEYESDLTCDDGHMVKSPYEKIIDNWLYAEGIKHAYEAKLDIDETHDITPDFFIPEYNGTKNI